MIRPRVEIIIAIQNVDDLRHTMRLIINPFLRPIAYFSVMAIEHLNGQLSIVRIFRDRDKIVLRIVLISMPDHSNDFVLIGFSSNSRQMLLIQINFITFDDLLRIPVIGIEIHYFTVRDKVKFIIDYSHHVLFRRLDRAILGAD